MSRPTKPDVRLRRWAAGLIAVLAVLVGGTWMIVSSTTSYLLTQDASSNAREWAEFLASNVADIEQIAAGEQPSAASMEFFKFTRNSGQVFRYVIFNRDGYSQLVSDHQKTAPVDLSEFSPEAARTIKTGLPYVAFRQADAPGLPSYYAEAYVPVHMGHQPVAIVAAYVGQTEQRAFFYKAFVAATTALCLLMAAAFGVPAVAWYLRTQEKQRADQRIRFLAHYDSLTELTNRARFIEELNRALDRQTRIKAGIALHFIDIDHFKDVNDTLGHDGGDFLLKTLADRLRLVARQGDLVARLGGDEFVVAQLGVSGQEQAEELARRICATLTAPVRFKEQQIAATVSVGIALSPLHGATSERLLKSADLAVYSAKTGGRNCVRVFSPEMDEAMHVRVKLETIIRDAVLHERFTLAYQPIYRLRGNVLTGFEALLRLAAPDGTRIPPSTFIPVVEELHLIGQLGAWALRQACRTAATWPDHLKVAVNLSPAQFDEPGVADMVAAALRDSGLAPSRLELEITEALLLANSARNSAELGRLKDMGTAVVLDDFGTGYSSLSYLWKFPFDKIKIDSSFLHDLGHGDRKVETVVKTIIALGRELRMPVTVEGVESAEQLQFLAGVDPQHVQGFYLGRPMSASEIPATILTDFRAGHAAAARSSGAVPPLVLVK